MVDSLPLPPPQVPLMRPDGQGKPTQQGFEFLGRLQSLVKSLASVTNIFDGLNATAATALLNLFTSTLKGLVPGSGGGTTNFLRADGTWAAPPVSGGLTLLSFASVGTGTTYSVTGLSGYKMLVIGVKGASHNSGVAQALNCALSGDNGSSYGTAFQISSGALSNVNTAFGYAFVTRADQTNNQLVSGASLALAGGEDTSSRGPINALQFSWASGANFDAGSIDIYGLK